jgi:CHAT domain-containing protein
LSRFVKRLLPLAAALSLLLVVAFLGARSTDVPAPAPELLLSRSRLGGNEVTELFVGLGGREVGAIPDAGLKIWSRKALELSRRAAAGDLQASNLLGVHRLLSGRLDEAIEQLGAAQGPLLENEARADLAAALLERSLEKRVPLDLVRAASLGLSRSAGMPFSPELETNTALALSRLGFRRVGSEMLARLVESEADPSWRRELEMWLADLRRATAEDRWRDWKPGLIDPRAEPLERVRRVSRAVTADPLRSRLLGEEALRLWARTTGAGSTTEAAAHLALAREIGSRLEISSHDSLLAEAVAGIVGATGSRTEKQLVDGFLHFDRGSDLLLAEDTDGARLQFERSRQELAAAGNAFSLRAEFFAAFCSYQRNARQGLEQLTALGKKLSDGRYPYLAGRVEWVVGSGKKTQGRLQEALDHYRRAELLLEKTAGPAESKFLGILVAETLQLAGDFNASWLSRLESIGQVPLYAQTERETAMYLELSTALAAVGAEEVAIAAISEMLGAAAATGSSYWLATAEVYAGLTRIDLGQSRIGLEHLERARHHLLAVSAGSRKEGLETRLELFRGIGLSRSRPRDSIRFLTSALAKEQVAGQGFFETRALDARGRAFLEIGQPELALPDFVGAVAAFERTRLQLADWKNRRAASKAAQAAAEILLETEDLAAVLPDGRQFQIADGLRAWALTPDRHGGGDGLPPTPERMQASLAGSTALVHYTLLRNRILVWVVTPDSISKLSLPIGRQEVLRQIGKLDAAFAAYWERGLQDSLRYFFDQLILPLEHPLSGMKRLVVVPDATLSAVPFTALYDSRRKRHLIEDVELGVVPSAALWLAHAEESPEILPPAALLIGVGEPQHGLPRLENISEEIDRVAKVLPAATVLQGGEATPQAISGLLTGRSIFYFAGHALADQWLPGASRLVLSGGTLENASFTIDQALAAGLGDFDLAVLAACSMSDHDLQDRDILLGAAGAIYAAGVPAVVASRRPVEDSFAVEAMPRFVSSYRQSGDAVQAWQAVVRELLQSDRPYLRSPLRWARIGIVGGIPAALPAEE